MISKLLHLDTDSAIEWFKISVNGWVSWLFLTLLLFFVYYTCVYSAVAASYEGEYYENIQSVFKEPQKKSDDVAQYQNVCTLERLKPDNFEEASVQLSLRFPKYLINFVDREAELVIFNNSDQVFQQQLIFYTAFERSDDPNILVKPLLYSEKQVAQTLWVDLKPCETRSYTYFLRTPQLVKGSYVRMRMGYVDQTKEECRNSTSEILTSNSKSEGQKNQKDAEGCIKLYKWHINQEVDDSIATQSCLKVNSGLDNSWLCSEISGFHAFRHSAIEWLLLSPWSNGLLPLAVFICVFLAETFAFQALEDDRRFYSFSVSRTLICTTLVILLLVVVMIVPVGILLLPISDQTIFLSLFIIYIILVLLVLRWFKNIPARFFLYEKDFAAISEKKEYDDLKKRPNGQQYIKVIRLGRDFAREKRRGNAKGLKSIKLEAKTHLPENNIYWPAVNSLNDKVGIEIEYLGKLAEEVIVTVRSGKGLVELYKKLAILLEDKAEPDYFVLDLSGLTDPGMSNSSDTMEGMFRALIQEEFQPGRLNNKSRSSHGIFYWRSIIFSISNLLRRITHRSSQNKKTQQDEQSEQNYIRVVDLLPVLRRLATLEDPLHFAEVEESLLEKHPKENICPFRVS